MAEAEQTIINKLKEWNNVFEGIELNYTYDKESNFHVVTVSPESIRRGDKKYRDAELHFWLNFMEYFPNENLLIDKPDDRHDMSNILYTNK